jgi:hypothetical protein
MLSWWAHHCSLCTRLIVPVSAFTVRYAGASTEEGVVTADRNSSPAFASYRPLCTTFCTCFTLSVYHDVKGRPLRKSFSNDSRPSSNLWWCHSTSSVRRAQFVTAFPSSTSPVADKSRCKPAARSVPFPRFKIFHSLRFTLGHVTPIIPAAIKELCCVQRAYKFWQAACQNLYKQAAAYLSCCHSIRHCSERSEVFTPYVTPSVSVLTYSMVQGIIWKADCYSARQKISRFLTEPESSSPCSQKPATEPYPEPAESSSPHRSLSPQGPS